MNKMETLGTTDKQAARWSHESHAESHEKYLVSRHCKSHDAASLTEV